MRACRSKTIAALAVAAAVLAVPGMALANGGDLHFGAVTTGVPMVAVYGFGGFFGVVVLFFMVNWALYRRSQRRAGPSSGLQGAPTRDEEEDDGTQ